MPPRAPRRDDDDPEHGSAAVSHAPATHDSSTSTSTALDPRTAHELTLEADAHTGVLRVEAAGKVFGRYSKWVLFASLGLASYIYSLDGSTTSSYLSFAASSFGEHSLISSVQVAQSVISESLCIHFDLLNRRG